MPKILPADTTRVLAVVSHLRFPALVALDRWGLVPLRGYGHRLRDPVALHSWDARTWGRRPERVNRLLARIRRSIVRYRPALIVLGVPAHESLFGRTLRARLAVMFADGAAVATIRETFRAKSGNISATARVLGCARSTLRTRLKKHAIAL